ncbi:MAG: phosphodiester glycosidase family protein, partial [Cyanobacteria bacterium P01_H01_bin.130]
VAVHARRGSGRGPSLVEMANLMQGMGAVNALNLDGGSSTTLYLGGQTLDRPSRTSARVHGVIGVFINP